MTWLICCAAQFCQGFYGLLFKFKASEALFNDKNNIFKTGHNISIDKLVYTGTITGLPVKYF